MNCRRARQLVFEFVDGLSDERVRLELENHIAECGECEKLASQVARSMDFVHRAPVEALDDNFNWRVRLAIHKERHAMQENLVSQGTLFRSWNIRYAASAAAGFAVVVAVGWMAMNAGVVSFDRGVLTGHPTLVAENAAPAPGSERTGVPTAEDNSAGRSSSPAFSDSPARMVSLGAPHDQETAVRGRGAFDESKLPVDLDSLVRAEMTDQTDEQRVQYLEERIRMLTTHLDQYKAKDE